MVTFSEIPGNLKIPFIRVEFDSKKAISGPIAQPYKSLLVGTLLSGGSGSVDTLYQVTNKDQAIALFGAGSVLAGMAEAYFARSGVSDLTMLAIAEPSGGAKATGSITVTGPATAAGTLNVYIAGRKVAVGVADEDTAATVAAAIVSKINANSNIPLAAAVNGGDDTQVDLTANVKGVVGNDIDVRINYNAEDETPAGIGISIDAMSSGSGVPDYSGVDALLGDDHFNFIGISNTDSASLVDIKSMLNDRGSSARMLEAVAVAGNTESVSTAGTLGNAHNNKFLSIISVKSSPTPSYEIAADAVKMLALETPVNPARSFQTVTLPWVKAPALTDRLTSIEQDVLLNDGIATTDITNDGYVAMQRFITTYKTNENGGVDESFLDVNTILLLSRLRYDFRNRIAVRFARHLIADDNQPVSQGQEILTPSIGKGFAVSLFKDWQREGWVEDLAQFKTDLVVERDSTTPTRMNFLLPVNIVNPLRQVATKLALIL